MASCSSPVGSNPTQIDPLRVIIDEIEGELLAEDRKRFLSLIAEQVGKADYHRLWKEFEGEDEVMTTTKVFDTLIEKMGKKKAINVSINAFRTMGCRHMSHGRYLDMPIHEILTDYLRDCAEHEEKTGLKDDDMFFGRKKEIEEIMGMFQDSTVKAVSISGMRGIGKTSLAQKVVYRMSHELFWEVHRIHLNGVDRMELMLSEVLRAVEALPYELLTLSDLKASLACCLREITQETLFLLDDVDDLCHSDRLECFVHHLHDILCRITNNKVKLLLTSTNKFQYSGVHRVPDVTDRIRPHFSGILMELELGKLPVPHCAALLQRYLDHAVGETDVAQVEDLDELARLCQQNPYLVKMVGKRLQDQVNKPKELVKLLKGSSLVRHVSVEEILKHAYLNLGTQFQSVLLKLSVFLSEFDAPAACTVLDDITSNVNSDLQFLRSRHFLVISDCYPVAEATNKDVPRTKHILFHVPSLIQDFLKTVDKSDSQIQMIDEARKRLCSYFHGFLEHVAQQSETGKNPRVLLQVIRFYRSIEYSLHNLSHIKLGDISTRESFLKALHLFNLLATPTLLRQDKDRLDLFQRYLDLAKSSGNHLFTLLVRLFIAHQHYEYRDTVNGWKEAEVILNEMEPEIRQLDDTAAAMKLKGKKVFKEFIGYALLCAQYCFIRAQVLGLKGNYAEASDMIDQARPRICKHAANTFQVVRIYNQMALVADYREHFDKAKFFYYETHEMARKILGSGLHPFLVQIMLNIGAYHHLAARRKEDNGDPCDEEYKCAIGWYDDAIKTLKLLHMFKSSSSVTVLVNFTSLCLDKDRTGEALMHAIDAKKISDEFKKEDPISQVRTTILLGRIFTVMARERVCTMDYSKHVENAEKEFDGVLRICKEKGFVAKDIGKGSDEHDVFWDDLCRYVRFLNDVGKNEKATRVEEMIESLNIGVPIPKSDSESSSSDGDTNMDEAMSDSEEEVVSRPKIQKQDSVDQAVPFKILRLSSADSEQSFNLSRESSRDEEKTSRLSTEH